MLTCWEGPSADLLHQNSLMLLSMTAIELDVFSGNMPTCTSQKYLTFGLNFTKCHIGKKPLGPEQRKGSGFRLQTTGLFSSTFRMGQPGKEHKLFRICFVFCLQSGLSPYLTYGVEYLFETFLLCLWLFLFPFPIIP